MRSYSLDQVAEICQVSGRTSEHWAATGELRTFNASRDRNSRRPRLRVLQSDLDAFLAARATDADAPQPRRRRLKIDVENFV
jgi:hypothetical protein